MKIHKQKLRNIKRCIGIINFNDTLYKINATRGTITDTTNANNILSIEDLPKEIQNNCYELIAIWTDNYEAVNKI